MNQTYQHMNYSRTMNVTIFRNFFPFQVGPLKPCWNPCPLGTQVLVSAQFDHLLKLLAQQHVKANLGWRKGDYTTHADM